MPQPAGHFVWFDLMTPDLDAAHDFYTRVVGWTLTDFEMEGQPEDKPPYRMWTAGETPVGGSVSLDEVQGEGVPPHWLAYVSVPDVDAASAKIEELGGSVLHGPEDIPTVGRFAACMDPQGAAFCIYCPQDEGAEQPADPQVGQFGWFELASSDPEGAMDFYGELFGWEKGDVVPMDSGEPYQLFQRPGGPPVGGVWKKPDEMPVSNWVSYVRVADIDASVDAVRELGGNVLFDPMEVPGGDRVTQFVDPHGAVFAMMERGSA